MKYIKREMVDSCVDVSGWNLDIPTLDLVNVVKDQVAWAFEYVFTDKDGWGFHTRFKILSYDKEDEICDPLQIIIGFPVLDENAFEHISLNLREFWYSKKDYGESEFHLEDEAFKKRGRVLAAALRAMSDEILLEIDE